MTSKRESQEQLIDNLIEQAKQEWESTVDSLPQLICLLNSQGYITRANRTVERWQLGSILAVKGREMHDLLHPGCADPACYLATFWPQAWANLIQGHSTEEEIPDKVLNRYLQIQIRPIATQTRWRDKATAAFAVAIIEDITRRKQVEEEREKLIAELDAFAHTVAHDLHNSLTAVIGYAEMATWFHRKMPVEELEESLEAILQSGHKMAQIIKELLLLASARNQEVEMRPLDMAAIVAETQQRLAYTITETQAEITMPTVWPAALGYGPWIEEVWTNYVSNALKYGGQPPRIALGVTVPAEPNGMIRFWVHDNGPGLKPEEQVRLFTPFTQLSQVQAKGQGLGLSIVRRIVERLGGQVGVESEGVPGQGCVFFFTLPALTK